VAALLSRCASSNYGKGRPRQRSARFGTGSDMQGDVGQGPRGRGMMTKQPTLTKADLIAEVERITELKRTDSEVIVETIFENIIQALQKGDKIEIRGFGSFRTRDRRGRVGRNPKTGAKVDVPPKKIPFFKPSKELKDFVNNSNGDAA
jgi:integration host factor subunit beta